MACINLLPWREQQREQEKKQFLVLLTACMGISVFMVFLIHAYAAGLVSNQLVRNQMLQHEISVFNQRLHELDEVQKLRALFISRITFIE